MRGLDRKGKVEWSVFVSLSNLIPEKAVDKLINLQGKYQDTLNS